MLETLKELALVMGRVVTILPLLLLVTILMGKRTIGELPIFDFLIILTLGSVVGADIADPDIHHIPTAFAIIVIGLVQAIASKWKISNRRFGRLITFEPTVVVQNGKLLDQNLRKIRYSIDNILQMLREKNIFDLSEVETAVIEANGSLSVLKKPLKNPVTLEDMNLSKPASAIAIPVIMEGKIYSTILKDFQLDENWLHQQLNDQGVHNVKDVFFATINRNKQLHVSLKNESNLNIPPIWH